MKSHFKQVIQALFFPTEVASLHSQQWLVPALPQSLSSS